MNGWTKIRAAVVGGDYRHHSGWVARHCGHQTALWPYTLSHPDLHPGQSVTSFNGRGFADLSAALAVVEGLAAGRYQVTAEKCVSGLLRVRGVTALGEAAHCEAL